MDTGQFFNEQREQSFIKSMIVKKYFYVWAKILAKQVLEKNINDRTIYYLDLFSGPGRYDDGKPSTPLLILETAIRDADIRRALIPIFNDEDSSSIQKLQTEIEQLEGVNSLTHKPVFLNSKIGDLTLKQVFPYGCTQPVLLFADPWGYKGLLSDFFSLISGWGSEVIFFFNYARINMALSNDVLLPNMRLIFGDSIVSQLTEDFSLGNLKSHEREKVVVEAVSKALLMKEPKILPPLHFRFKDEYGSRTIHHLVFVTKNKLGYVKMKEIMNGLSTESAENVGLFEFNPHAQRQPKLLQPNLPIEDLIVDLSKKYQNIIANVKDIYFEHNIGTPYGLPHYQEAFKRMEVRKMIEVNPPASQRRRVKGVLTLSDSCIIMFK